LKSKPRLILAFGGGLAMLQTISTKGRGGLFLILYFEFDMDYIILY